MQKNINPTFDYTPYETTGTSCTGDDEAEDRTLTISGVYLSLFGRYSIAINGAFLHEGASNDYTVSDNVITFNNKIWNTDHIRVIPH